MGKIENEKASKGGSLAERLEINEGDLKTGLLSLVVALVEIIKDALQLQALKRMEGGSLTEEEIDRLGVALMSLNSAIESIKMDMGLTESVRSLRQGLDRTVAEVISGGLEPALSRKSRQDVAA